ncbi:MAG TPA: glycoside hydrolase domain-containing protein, partial [Solirubrobacterales bacterium]|nr:glycoside hydrolase domain-containing protein [Solirubrobacterales bacterium]
MLAALLPLILPGSASASEERSVRFDGRTIAVPAEWPVYRLKQHPGMCVRLDRRAVYLGTPSAQQRCPSDAIGRQRAILVEPRRSQRPGASALPVAPRPLANASAATSSSGAIFTGLGFDACTAPSAQAMSAWKRSPYRSVGVYIGGLNRACSQPNLTANWVASQTAAGWYLIPTYVG